MPGTDPMGAAIGVRGEDPVAAAALAERDKLRRRELEYLRDAENQRRAHQITLDQLAEAYAERDELRRRGNAAAARMRDIYREANEGTADAHRRLVTIMEMAAAGDDDA